MSKFPEISGPRLIAQVDYCRSAAAQQTAAGIVAQKCHNSAGLLKKFLPYQQRYPERAMKLTKAINKLERIEQRLHDQQNLYSQLLSIEARAGFTYWHAFATLVNHIAPDWHRVHPHAADPINTALNIGYTLLARWIKEKIQSAALAPQVGILHVPAAGHDPLVYDVMELHRQPIIDAIVIPFFTKKKQSIGQLTPIEIGHLVSHFQKQWEQPVPYHGQYWPIKDIVWREVVRLARAMNKRESWIPWAYPWGHGWSCANYRPSPNKKKRPSKKREAVE